MGEMSIPRAYGRSWGGLPWRRPGPWLEGRGAATRPLPGRPSCGLWLGQGFPASALGECLGSKPRGFFDWAGGRGAMNQGLQLGASRRDAFSLQDAVTSPGWWEGTQQGWVRAGQKL